MPFDQTSDYFNPLPAFQVGLQLGHQVAQQKFQAESIAIAQKRNDILEQEDLRKKVQDERAALRIQQQLDERDRFQNVFRQNTQNLKAELDRSPNRFDYEDELAKIPKRALDMSVPAMPIEVAAKYVAGQEAMDSREEMAAAKNATELSKYDERNKARFEELKATHDAEMDRLKLTIASREHLAELKSDAEGYNGSEDQFATQKLSAIMKANRVGPDEAEVIARTVYRKYHKGGAGAAGLPEAPEKESELDAKLRKLSILKADGVKRVKVDGSDVTPDPSWRPFTDNIDDEIKKAELSKKLQGGTAAPAEKGVNVFKFDPKTGRVVR